MGKNKNKNKEKTTLQHKNSAYGMKRAVYPSSDSLTPVDLNIKN